MSCTCGRAPSAPADLCTFHRNRLTEDTGSTRVPEGGWLESGHGNLAASLTRFAGSPAYGPGSLICDFARFRFLLGVTDGEGLFTPDEM